MTRCAEGHLFDPARHSTCPWCGTGVALGGAAGAAIPESPGKTVALRPAGRPAVAPPPPPPAVPHAAIALPDARGAGSMIVGGDESLPRPDIHSKPTERLIRKATGIDPVVGWLVALTGPMRGQDFTLRAEKNFIGRDPSMHIALAGDPAVSRDNHAALVFEPRKQEFWLIPGDASGLVYCNGELVNGPTILNDRDTVELGSSRLMLVAFVSQQFHWEAEPPRD